MGEGMKLFWNLKQKNRTGFFWLLGMVIFLTLIFWFLPRYDVFEMEDIQWVRYGLMATHDFGIAHIPFGLLMRPGFLLNLPGFILIGRSFAVLSLIYSLVAMLAGWVFYWGWFVKKGPVWILPVSLTLGLLISSEVFTWVFNYFNTTGIFLLYGFGFYGACINRSKSKFFAVFLAVLAGLCISIALMGNLAMAPGVFLMGLLLVGLYWHRWSWVYLLSLVCISGFFLWGYLIHWGILDRLIHDSLSESSTIRIQILILINLSSVFLLNLFIFFIYQKVIKKYFSKKAQIKAFEILFWLSALGFLIANFIFVTVQIDAHLEFGLFFSVSILMILSTYQLVQIKTGKVPQKEWAVILVFFGICILNTTISRTPCIASVYIPFLLLWLIGMWHEAGLLVGWQEKLCWFGLVVFILMEFKNLIVPSYVEGPKTGWEQSYWISQNNTYSPAWDAKMPQQDAELFSNYVRLYQQYHCDQKGLLAYDQLVSMYGLVHRLPPYDIAWMDRGLIYPLDRHASGEESIAYLKNQPHGWCVVYRERSGFGSREKLVFHRDLIFNYLETQKTSVNFIGKLAVSGDQVFLLVKEKN